MTRKRIGLLAGVAVIAAAGIGVGVAVAVSGPGGRPAAAGTTAGPGYSWYHSMMSRYYGGSMMGGSSGGWMMGRQGYQWMMGGASAPGWMRGGRLPGSMMMVGTTDPGQIMVPVAAVLRNEGWTGDLRRCRNQACSCHHPDKLWSVAS